MATDLTHNELVRLLVEYQDRPESERKAWIESLTPNNRRTIEKEMKTRSAMRIAAERQAALVNADRLAAERATAERLAAERQAADERLAAAERASALNPSDRTLSSSFINPSSSSIAEEDTDMTLAQMWDMIDNSDVEVIDKEALRIFEYQGFNPDDVLKSLVLQKIRNRITNDEFTKDIFRMCTLAIVKGSVNDHNFKRMSERGQAEYKRLEAHYNLKRGSGRNQSSSIVTISRVAATFPGKIIELLAKDMVAARKFTGPFKSQSLPAILRHQAFAAVIPSSLGRKTREFLLDIVTAYSVDQSICIGSKRMLDDDAVTDLFNTQRNYINLSFNNVYPSESVRKKIFKDLELSYEDTVECALEVTRYVSTFDILNEELFNQDVKNLM